MKAPRRLFPLLFLGVPLLGALALGAAVAAVETPALGGVPLAPWQARLAEGADPAVVAGELPVAALADLQGQNALRLGLKAQDRAPVAEAFFSALAQRDPTDAVLLNLSLSYVDQMTGKSLLRQGDLSSRSQRAVARILARDADRWVAWYIRGINNLYWPDWFRKAPLAQESLARAVAIVWFRCDVAGPLKLTFAPNPIAGELASVLRLRAWPQGRDEAPFREQLREVRCLLVGLAENVLEGQDSIVVL